MIRNQRGQVTAELAVLFAFVIAGFVFMGFYLQRAAQGSTKANTDAIGNQFSVNAGWESISGSDSRERTLVAGGSEVTSSSCSAATNALGGAALEALPTGCTPSGTATGYTPTGGAASILLAPTGAGATN